MKPNATVWIVGLLVALLQVGCAKVLDAETLEELTILPYRVSAQPGESVQYEIGVIECCHYLVEVDADVTWWVEPDWYASMGQTSGLLEVHDNAPPWWECTVIADVEAGRRILTESVTVYTVEANPFVGNWKEVSQIDCDSGDPVEPLEPIREILFRANGEFLVTWHPFETYADYWGIYGFDQETSSLTLGLHKGNYVPQDFLGNGSFRIDDPADMLLEGIWFGNSMRNQDSGVVNCGHRLELLRR